MKKISFFLIAIAFLASCQPTKKTEKVEIDNRYSVELPTFLTKTTGLNEDASLQYENQAKELYMIVIDESISEFQDAVNENAEYLDYYSNDFTGYCDFVFDLFTESLNTFDASDWKKLDINGLEAMQKGVKGNIQDLDVFYHYTVIKGTTNYYQVLLWTLHDKKSEHQPLMDEIVNSFKELK